MNETYRVMPLRVPFDVRFPLPGSKSVANRAIVMAALADGVTRIEGATPVDDVSYLVTGLAQLGFQLRWIDKPDGTLEVVGGVPRGSGAGGRLYLGNAGTAMRFLTSVAMLVPGEWTLVGDPRMHERPIADLVAAWRALGGEIAAPTGAPPVTLRGGCRTGGTVRIGATVSSQYVSSFMMVGSLLEGGLELEVEGLDGSASYLSITRDVMRSFGVDVTWEGDTIRVSAGSPTSPGTYRVEGDWSGAGAFSVLAELTGSRFEGSNLSDKSPQGDRRLDTTIAQLRGSGCRLADVSDMPDQLMNLAILAAFRDGATEFTGASRLRVKESDRLGVIVTELTKGGIEIVETVDGVKLAGSTSISEREQRVVLDPHDDHRMAMAFAILGAVRPGVEIRNRACVSKSYPAFFDDFERIYSDARCVALIGMRGAGKSTLARALAPRLAAARARFPSGDIDRIDTERIDTGRIDTDDEFIRIHGPIDRFVAERGWEEFRRIEEELTIAAIGPCRVVALGGGAIESSRVREVLRRAIVVFLDEPLEKIAARVRGGPTRPSVTGEDIVAELAPLMKRRDPLYRTAADVVIADNGSVEECAERVIRALRRLASARGGEPGPGRD